MPRFEVLKKRRQFLRLNRRARRTHDEGFVLQTLAAEDALQPPRFGFTVTKRIGNAVVRNRAKRRLRSLCREIVSSPDWKKRLQGHDFVLIARSKTPTLCYQSLLESLRHALKDGLKKAHQARDKSRKPASSAVGGRREP